MGLFRRIRQAGERVARTRVDSAERITPRGVTATSGEQVSLAEGEKVRGWLRELGPEETVLVHRAWGTLAARHDRRYPPGVILSDSTGAWFAVPPDAADNDPLTLKQVEHIVIEAMTSPARPQWPRWVALS